MVKVFPDGSIGWPLLLRGGATVEPPSIDIGADILDIERRPAEPSRITVCRQSPEDAGYREVFVSLDGEQVAMLQYGDTFTFEVKPGPHKLRAHNTLFWKTIDLVLKPGEHARFIAINRAGWGTFGFMTFLGASPLYLTFERQQQ